MTALATRHIGNDVHAQTNAVFDLLDEAHSALFFHEREDKFYLGTTVCPDLDERALVALDRLKREVKHSHPEFREALKNECRRRRLVA